MSGFAKCHGAGDAFHIGIALFNGWNERGLSTFSSLWYFLLHGPWRGIGLRVKLFCYFFKALNLFAPFCVAFNCLAPYWIYHISLARGGGDESGFTLFRLALQGRIKSRIIIWCFCISLGNFTNGFAFSHPSSFCLMGQFISSSGWSVIIGLTDKCHVFRTHWMVEE